MIPIGYARTPYAEPSGMPIQGGLAPEVTATVEILEPFAPGLADLDGFSHLVLIYRFDRARPGYDLTVRPYLDERPRGLFATRAPRRPSGLGFTVVRLLEVRGCELVLQGVDLLDGTPILDIKPYVPAFDRPEGPVRIGWLEEPLAEGRRPRSDGRFHGE